MEQLRLKTTLSRISIVDICKSVVSRLCILLSAQWILVRLMGFKRKAMARQAALTGTGTNISLEDCCQENNTSIWEPKQSNFTLFSTLDVQVHSLIMSKIEF